MKNPLVIFGTGHFAEVACFYFNHDSDYQVVAFTVNGSHLDKTEFCGKPVVPFEEVEELYPSSHFHMFIAVGYAKMNRIRERLYNEAKAKGYTLATYLSSKATHWGDTKIGDNCFIFEDNTIQPFVKIGNDTVLWSGNHIGHHVSIGDHCFVTSHAVIAGSVSVGVNCFIGINATIRDSIRIADGCLIGAGALIMKDTKRNEVYVGERTKPAEKDSTQIGF